MPTATQVKFITVRAFKKGDKPWNFGTLKMITGICKTCGKEFTTRKRNDRSHNFCSVECSVKNLHTQEIISKRGIRILDRTKLKKSERVKTDSASMYWKKEIYKRDNYKCRINNADCNEIGRAHV